MAGKHDIVRQDDIVAELAIMGDMRIGEKEVVAADHGLTAAFGGSGVHRHAFAHRAVVADGQRGFLAGMVNALRIAADDGAGMDPGIAPDSRAAGDDGMGEKFATVAERRLRPDMAEGADFHIRPDHSAVLDDGHGVNDGAWRDPAHFSSLRMIMAPISASATRAPSTLASQWNFQILPRCFCLKTWNSTRSPGTTGLRKRALSMVMK